MSDEIIHRDCECEREPGNDEDCTCEKEENEELKINFEELKRVKDFLKYEEISPVIRYALKEFQYAGWCDENYEFEEPDETDKRIFGMNMQEAMCVHILKLLSLFSNEEHSGITASYALSVFNKLVNFDPLTPIEDVPDQWVDHTRQHTKNKHYQHKRCGKIFKDETGKAWNIEGKVFYRLNEKGDRIYYTDKDSSVPVTFPYNIPKDPIVEYKE